MPRQHPLRSTRIAPALAAVVTLAALVSLAVPALAAGPAAPFPPVDPARVGIPAQALETLAGRVRQMVEEEEIVGGELLVIKNRRTVLRRAFGWKDREAQQPLAVDAVYCVRSMTKPLIGTAIQMLIDDGRLRLDTPVHRILPSFSGPEARRITVEHLLTHTSGLPFSTLDKPLTAYSGLADVAAEAASRELGFEPGSGFQYSDAGSDTLGAIVAAVSGEPAERFIQRRILDPLGMEATHTLLTDDMELRARVPTAYSGGTGSWTEHWKPSDPPIFPFFLSSQSLYTTTSDYARFLALWLDHGTLGDRRLLSAAAVTRALAPHRLVPGQPRRFGDLDLYYGQQWMVYARDTGDGSPRRVLFGHDGSDGTHAWAWPQRDLMVLFFTQSRGTVAGLDLESTIQDLLIDPAGGDSPTDADSPLASEPAESGTVAPGTEATVAGLYWDETNAAAYYVVSVQGRKLVLDRPGRAHLVFKPSRTDGRYVYEGSSDAWIEFVRSDDGSVTAMRSSFGGHVEVAPRHVPPSDLPSVADVVERVRQAHHMDRLAGLGVIRLSGAVELADRHMQGRYSVLFDGTRQRTVADFGAAQEIGVVNGEQAWSYATPTGSRKLGGTQREQALLDRLVVTFGDWRRSYEEVEVLARLKAGDRPLLLVRVVPHETFGATMFVDEASGRVVVVDSLVQVPGVGIVGVQTRFGDYRDVGGLLLPFKTVARFANPQIGTVVWTVEHAEPGVEVPDRAFSRPRSTH